MRPVLLLHIYITQKKCTALHLTKLLFRKLHGLAAARFDVANNKKEEELDVQNQFLADQRKMETEAGTKDKNA